jgi:hypothetical protein
MTVRQTDELTARLRAALQDLTEQQQPAGTAQEVSLA